VQATREEQLTPSAVDFWKQEIRDYLLGRLQKGSESLILSHSSSVHISHTPIRRWWMFEGKRYSSLGGPLAGHWREAIRSLLLLRHTFNPTRRISDRPDGLVDWPQTLSRGVASAVQEYVVCSSGVGLGHDEHSALVGWQEWILAEWRAYCDRFDLDPLEQDLSVVGADSEPREASLEQLHRWAHLARRSRWPFLRDVVAESIRTAIEPDDVDRIPLPVERSTLFEMLCLVRLLKALAPGAEEMRWLDHELNNNTLTAPGMECNYHWHLDADRVLACTELSGGLAEATRQFGLRVPQFVDIAIHFKEPRGGFDGIIVEAKSGSQSFWDAMPQLKVYRAAFPRRRRARYVLWGIIEQSDRKQSLQDDLSWLRKQSQDNSDDLWVFSGAEHIAPIANALICGHWPGLDESPPG
jgi:hypothetical protein